MSTDIVKIPADIIKVMKGAFGGDGLPMPFVKEIFLISCHIAGTSYSKDIDKIEKELHLNDILLLRRDPKNPHDELAILVLDEKGRKLGYVPQAQNEVIARLMDAGKLIFGKIEEKQYKNSWLKINIRLFMRDF
jgi:hypothetical protein